MERITKEHKKEDTTLIHGDLITGHLIPHHSASTSILLVSFIIIEPVLFALD